MSPFSIISLGDICRARLQQQWVGFPKKWIPRLAGPLKQEAYSPERGELREDGNEQYRRLDEPDEQSYGEDKETLTSLCDPDSARDSHSFSLGADVAYEQGAHQGRSDVEPVDASYPEAKQDYTVDVAV